MSCGPRREHRGEADGGEGGRLTPPACLRWASHLHHLLEDSEGVQLFRKYLDQEGRSHADTLNFWFACQGLKKQTDQETVAQLVKVIYRRYFLKTQLAVPEALRVEVHRQLKEAQPHQDVFDAVQAEVERLVNQTTYPNFLKSDMYLRTVRAAQDGSPPSPCTTAPCATLLATLHEDAELVTGSELPLPLTRDTLMATQRRRAAEARPRPEAYAGVYLAACPPLPPHAPYSSYNPVSRQDSELQSLSSEARTESDSMSLTDSSVDLGRGRVNRKQYARQCRLVRESASVNREPHLHHSVIPRTQRVQKESLRPMSPVSFAAILREKLEGVKRDREAQDKLGRLMEDAQEDQDILDQHVSRVWSDQTPLPSPRGVASPRPLAPPSTSTSTDSGFPSTEHRLPKSKSVPDYLARRAAANKKALTDDSGVSVASSRGTGGGSRVLTWLLESHDPARRRAPEQGPGPAQPFVADPSMPPLPSPHTATQLEEARRRLMAESKTLRKSKRTEEFTTVVFSFCDEQFPYRTKIPGRLVTLRQFKEFLPKKGSYRFFFKTECDDLDTRVIQEEITEDGDVLPLWEGKVMAQVKPVV